MGVDSCAVGSCSSAVPILLPMPVLFPQFLHRFVAAGFVLAAAGVVRGDEAKEKHFAASIKPKLEKHCYSCHGPEKQKGDLNLADFATWESVTKKPKVWREVLQRVQADEMPPEGAKVPIDYGAKNELMDWLRELPKPKEVDCNEVASDRTENYYKGHVMSRRLNRDEYDNTVRDLFGVDVKAGRRNLPADGAGGEGFDTTGDTLFTTSLAIEKYVDAAEEITRSLLPDAGTAQSPALQAARDRLVVARPSDQVPAREAARQVLARLTRLAFRRPVEAAEVDKYLKLFDLRQAKGQGYEASLRLALRGVLVSPHFLFLVEPENPAGGVQQLPGPALACRLSYFLWASMPDEELLKTAESGELGKPEVCLAQVRRMVKDPRAAAFGERFAMQWLELEKLGADVKPDPGRYPEFDAGLLAAMRGEVTEFFNHLVAENRPLTDLIDCDYSYVNERLAGIYGMPEVKGEGFQRVALKSRERGGLTGMAGIHALTSYPLRTSPVLRGRWLAEVVLGERIPPPPPNVPALPKDEKQLDTTSLREQLEQHRKDPNCAACHNRMDPLGFGLETFDVLGRLRLEVAGRPVDAHARMPSGEEFNGPEGLKKILLARKEQIMKHLVKKMTGYALGRELNHFDQCVIKDAMAALAKTEYRPAALIETIAMSKPFQFRFYPKTETVSTKPEKP